MFSSYEETETDFFGLRPFSVASAAGKERRHLAIVAIARGISKYAERPARLSYDASALECGWDSNWDGIDAEHASPTTFHARVDVTY